MTPSSSRAWSALPLALAVAVALAIAPLASAIQAQGAPEAHAVRVAEAPDDLPTWSAALWQAALADDTKQVEALLGDMPHGASDAADRLLAQVATHRAHRALDAQDRITHIQKREKDLAKAVEGRDITSALVHAVNMKFLMSPEQWRTWLRGSEGIAVEAMADQELEKAIKAQDLLLAQEILFRHKALHDGVDTDTFKALDSALDEINRRVTLIAEYAPRELHRMRKTQVERLERIARAEGRDLPKDDEEFPPYNELFANDWKDRIAGITPRLLRDGLRQAASEHVTAAGWKPLMLGGLMSLEVLLQTPQLAENFHGLADAARVAALREVVATTRAQIEQLPPEKVTPASFRGILNEVLAANAATVELPEEVVLKEFGEGATTQLSKEYEDDYSEIIWPDNLRRFKQSIEGNFVGVGILIRHNDKRELIIVNPLEGSPASRAGIRPSDKCIAVDDQSTVGWALTRAVDNITGPVGQPVKLTVKRDGVDKPIDFTLKRESIKMRSVNGWWKRGIDTKGKPQWDWWIDPDAGIGYVRLTSFSEDSFSDFMDAIRQMKRERTLNGLVLDLRGNPGGLLKSAVSFANLFVEEGPLVTVQDRYGNTTGGFGAERVRASLAGLPLVVLINGQSASASEILSGSLQVHGAAIVLGDRSFGKGSVQTVQPVQDGASEAAVKVTTQYYVLPPVPGAERGRLVHRRAASDDWGVNPDMNVPMTPPQMEKSAETRLALDQLDEAQGALPTVDIRPDVRDLLDKRIDPQLEMALLLLQARTAGDAERAHLAGDANPATGKARQQ